jgi:hypothetical protein
MTSQARTFAYVLAIVAIVVDPKGLVLTNNHVVEHATRIQVVLFPAPEASGRRDPGGQSAAGHQPCRDPSASDEHRAWRIGVSVGPPRGTPRIPGVDTTSVG